MEKSNRLADLRRHEELGASFVRAARGRGTPIMIGAATGDGALVVLGAIAEPEVAGFIAEAEMLGYEPMIVGDVRKMHGCNLVLVPAATITELLEALG